jgi:hypothetical protein
MKFTVLFFTLGAETDAIDITGMEVDWIKVYVLK